MHLEKELSNRSAGISDPQIGELPFQKGVPLDLPEHKGNQEVKDLCCEILMVRISEVRDSEDDSMERLNLDNYNSDDYDEYLSDNIKSTPLATTEVKTTIKQDPTLSSTTCNGHHPVGR